MTAFGVGGDLGSVTIALPDTNSGLADPTVRMDTSSFLSLVGITGYRISRVDINNNGNWVGDDFTFADPVANVPEPGNGRGLLALGVLGLVFFRRVNRSGRSLG